MNNIFKYNKSSVAKLDLLMIYTLIPLLFYAFYKNGLHLYIKSIVELIYIIKPVLIIIGSGLLGFLLTIIFKKYHFKYQLILSNLLISLCVSININIYLYFIALLIMDIIFIVGLRKIKINFVALSVIIITLVTYLVSNYTFLNHYEEININTYNLLDYIIGRSIGGLGTTSILLIIGSLTILAFNFYYKLDVAITGIIIYILCGMWYLIVNPSITSNLMLVCCNSVIFAFVYIMPLNQYSPKTSKWRYIYAASIAILTFIGIFIFKLKLSVFMAIVLVNIGCLIINLIKKRK